MWIIMCVIEQNKQSFGEWEQFTNRHILFYYSLRIMTKNKPNVKEL